MITAETLWNEIRSRKVDEINNLVQALQGAEPVRAQDPIQTWEAHSVVGQYLDALKDKEIAYAIDVVNGAK